LAVEIVAAMTRSKSQGANIDAMLKALQDKQCSLKLKRIAQFSELGTASGAPTCTQKSPPRQRQAGLKRTGRQA